MTKIYRKDVVFVIFLLVPFYFFIHFIIVPVTTEYSFQTVTKFEGDYPEPIFLTFHWKTADELMVGKQITVFVDVKNLPYTQNDTVQEINIKFNNLNYFSNQFDEKNEKITQVDYLSLYPVWNENKFSSDPIKIRYIVPIDVSVDLCDYNSNEECMKIEQIIHPAPHDTFVLIDNARTSIGVSLSILSLTIIIVWVNFRPKYARHKLLTESRIRSLTVGLIIILSAIVIIEYARHYILGDLS